MKRALRLAVIVSTVVSGLFAQSSALPVSADGGTLASADWDRNLSPRIYELRQVLEAGDSAALEKFWDQIREHGAPLVEGIPDDNRHVLVSFVWRSKEAINNVVLLDGPAGWDFVNNQLTHLGTTDLWYRSYRVRKDARFTYSFSVNDPLTYAEDRPGQPDPFNRHPFITPKDEDDPNDTESVESAVELPDAPPQAWINPEPGIPSGRIERHHFTSAMLGNDRRIWVYTPAGYAPRSRPYRLLVLLDGWDYTHVIPTPTILDNLIGKNLIQPLVAVMVDDFPGERRRRELVNDPSFPEFLVRELVPWIRKHYRVTSDPAQTIVGGFSAGGYAAARVAFGHSEVFGNILSQSGSFTHGRGGFEPVVDPEDVEYEWLTRQFVTTRRLPLRFYLEVGLFEHFEHYRGPTQLLANRHLRDVLQAKGYSVSYSEFPGNHTELCWRGTLANGLLFLAGKAYKRN